MSSPATAPTTTATAERGDVPADHVVPGGRAARALHAAVRAYRWAAAGRRSPCRYYPSCSSYALEALETHGAARGGWLTLRRLGRCHPLGGHGVDLVPPASDPPSHRTPSPAPPADAERKVP